MAIHLSGSLAFDRIMTFPGKFEDHLLPEKLHILNVSFLINRIEEKRGGTAGNIAYNLSLMGEKPQLYGSVGRDFSSYRETLAKAGVNMDGVRTLEKEFTACAYITTDRMGNQITGFSPAAMNTPSPDPDPSSGDWAVVSPGNLDDMRRLPALYRARHIPYIFDPGQSVTALSADALLEGFSGAAVLIGNDYEIELIGSRTGLTKAEMLQRADCLIITLGEAGSDVLRPDVSQPFHIEAAPIPHVADPTGAGDAYRAGLVKGLHAGLGVEASARLGSTCSSFCIECYGTQEHSFQADSFLQRYESAYGPMPVLPWPK